MKDQWQTLLNEEMSRADFLRYVASIILAVIGVSGLLRTIFRHQSSSGLSNNSYGYSSGIYGGKK